MDDDFKGNTQLPLLHATDSAVRAIENPVVSGLGITSGVSMIINSYGKILARSGFNQRRIIQVKPALLQKQRFTVASARYWRG